MDLFQQTDRAAVKDLSQQTDLNAVKDLLK